MARHTDWPCVWWPRIEAALRPQTTIVAFSHLGTPLGSDGGLHALKA